MNLTLQTLQVRSLIGLFNNILSDARREASETKKPLATKWIKGLYETINHVFENNLVS